MEDEISDLISSGRSYPVRPKISDYSKLFKIKTNLFLFFQGIAGTVPWGAIPYYMVEFFRRERGLSVSVATTVFMVFGLGNVLGTFLGGWIGHKLYLKSARWVPLFSSITTGLGVIATVLTISYRPVGGIGLLMLVVLGFASAALVSLTGPNVKMMLLNVNEPGDRG